MQKILYIENFKIFKDWASKTDEYKFNEIKNNPLYEYLDIDDIDDKIIDQSKYLCVIFGWNVTPISKFYTLKFTYYSKYIKNLDYKEVIEKKIKQFLQWDKKYLVIQDLFDYDYEGGLPNLCKYLTKYNFNGLITPYHKTETLDYVLSKIKIKIIHMHHHIDDKYFKKYNLKKKYDIFVFGTINTHYPFRQKLNNILKKNKDKFNILFWSKFRNYFRFESNKSNNQLSKAMNQSWLTICTSGKFNMLFGKYFEASMSNSTICGNMPIDGKNIWNDNYINLDYSMSEDEIINVLENALKYKSSLLKKSNIMYSKMNEFHLNKFSQKLYFKIQLDLIN